MTEEPEHSFVVNGKLAAIADLAGRYCDAQLAHDKTACIMAHMVGVTGDNEISVMPLAVPGEMIDTAREALFERALGGVFTRMVFFCEAWVRTLTAEETKEPRTGSLGADPRALEAVVFEGRDSDGNVVKCSRLIDRDVGKLGDARWVPPERTRYLPSSTDERGTENCTAY